MDGEGVGKCAADGGVDQLIVRIRTKPMAVALVHLGADGTVLDPPEAPSRASRLYAECKV